MTENVSMGERLEPVVDLVGKTVVLVGDAVGKRGVVKSQTCSQGGHPFVCVLFPDGSHHDCMAGEVEVVNP